MSTGDLLNNARKLVRHLRQVNYRDEVDTESLSLGNPSAFLGILHHILLQFSLPLSNYLCSQGFELFAKSDMRFMQEAYKVFRNELKYQPRLTVAQFLNDGFAERKIMMMCDVIQLCLEKNYELMRKPLRVLDRNARSLCSWDQVYGHSNTGHDHLLKHSDGEARSMKKTYRWSSVKSVRPTRMNGEEKGSGIKEPATASHLLFPASTSSVDYCNDDSTIPSCSVQRHYSKRAGALPSNDNEENTESLNSNETVMNYLRLQELEPQSQTVEASEHFLSRAVSTSVSESSASFGNVRRCHSSSLESDHDHLRQSDKSSVLNHCPMLKPPPPPDTMSGVFAYKKCRGQMQGTTNECCQDDQLTPCYHSSSASAIHVLMRLKGQHLTRGEDVENKISVTTQGTQTDFFGETEDEQLANTKVNNLAQRLLTLEARLTLTETRLNLLETRQDEAT